jgi:hypothetical protein
MKRVFVSAGVLFSAVVAASFPGCSSSDTGDPSTSTSGSGGAAASSTGQGGTTALFGTSACATCAQARCLTEVDTCGADEGCSAYLDCLFACPLDAEGQSVDLGCAGACPPGDTAASQAASSGLFSCFTAGAATQCLECGGKGTDENGVPIETCPPSSDANPCFVCEDERCCVEFEACLNGPCLDFANCVIECSASSGLLGACMAQCGDENPEGRDLRARLDACIAYQCAGCGNDDPCGKCLDETCRFETYELYSAPLGVELYYCVVDCFNAGGTAAECADTCYEGYPSQRALFDVYVQCISGSCGVECS